MEMPLSVETMRQKSFITSAQILLYMITGICYTKKAEKCVDASCDRTADFRKDKAYRDGDLNACAFCGYLFSKNREQSV